MHRRPTAVAAVLTTVVAVIGLSAAPALAKGKPVAHAKAEHGSSAHHGKAAKPKPKPHKVHPLVTFTGVISDTSTATTVVAAPSTDTSTASTEPTATAPSSATSTVTIAVKGGARELHATTVVLTLDASTVVRRGDRAATAADLRKGDHVSVRARRMPDGSWLGLRVNASASRAAG